MFRCLTCIHLSDVQVHHSSAVVTAVQAVVQLLGSVEQQGVLRQVRGLHGHCGGQETVRVGHICTSNLSCFLVCVAFVISFRDADFSLFSVFSLIFGMIRSLPVLFHLSLSELSVSFCVHFL